MKNNILNEGYKSSTYFFEKGKGDKIYSNKKYFIDTSNCAGSLLLGHNHKIFKKSVSNYCLYEHPKIQYNKSNHYKVKELF